MAYCVILGDKDYLSASQQIDLFEQATIKLETPMRSNQLTYQNNLTSFVNPEKELKLCSLNYVISL